MRQPYRKHAGDTGTGSLTLRQKNRPRVTHSNKRDGVCPLDFDACGRGRNSVQKKIILGTDFFDKMIVNNGYYVDKTEMVYELVEKNANEVTLFTRPRRFGKSLTMSMLESFFDIKMW